MRTILLVLPGLSLAQPGADCVTDAGLAEWMQQERSRSEAEAEGSRSIVCWRS